MFREILDALEAEGSENVTIAEWAATLNANMEARAVAWSQETFPYGSEFNCAYWVLVVCPLHLVFTSLGAPCR